MTTAISLPMAHTEHLVLALMSVDGTMAACVDHGDPATLAVLSAYYALIAAGCRDADGRVVKVMGDGVLIAFPLARAVDAASACRQLQADATRHWRAFDARCRARVVMNAGPVLSGELGPPGQQACG